MPCSRRLLLAMVTESTQKAVSQATCSHLLCARQRPAHFDSVRGQRSYFCAHPQSHGLLSVPRRSAITRPPRRVNCPAREGLAISSQQRHAACNMIRDHDRAGLQALRLSRTSSLAADRVIWPPAQPALTGLPMLGSAAQLQHHSHHDAQRPPPRQEPAQPGKPQNTPSSSVIISHARLGAL